VVGVVVARLLHTHTQKKKKKKKKNMRDGGRWKRSGNESACYKSWAVSLGADESKREGKK
jgi:hypothetical protein